MGRSLRGAGGRRRRWGRGTQGAGARRAPGSRPGRLAELRSYLGCFSGCHRPCQSKMPTLSEREVSKKPLPAHVKADPAGAGFGEPAAAPGRPHLRLLLPGAPPRPQSLLGPRGSEGAPSSRPRRDRAPALWTRAPPSPRRPAGLCLRSLRTVLAAPGEVSARRPCSGSRRRALSPRGSRGPQAAGSPKGGAWGAGQGLCAHSVR